MVWTKLWAHLSINGYNQKQARIMVGGCYSSSLIDDVKTAWYNWRSRLVGRALQPLESTSPKGFIPNGLAWDAFDWVVENNMVRSSWWILFCIILTTHAMLFPRFALASGLLDISKTLPQHIFVIRDAGSHVSIMWGFLCLQTLHSQPPGISLPVNMLLRMSVSWAASGSSIQQGSKSDVYE